MHRHDGRGEMVFGGGDRRKHAERQLTEAVDAAIAAGDIEAFHRAFAEPVIPALTPASAALAPTRIPPHLRQMGGKGRRTKRRRRKARG